MNVVRAILCFVIWFVPTWSAMAATIDVDAHNVLIIDSLLLRGPAAGASSHVALSSSLALLGMVLLLVLGAVVVRRRR